MVHMGKLIRRIRKQRGITQAELSQGIMSESVLSRIENGNFEPDVLTLSRMMFRLGASLHFFEILVDGQEYEELQKYKSGEKTGGTSELTIISEQDFFKDYRKSRGWSQEQFSENVCARETISKIENGRKPNRKKRENLLRKLGEEDGKYFGYVETAEYFLYSMVEQCQNLICTSPADAWKILLEIQDELDMELPANRQFCESSKLRIQKKLGDLSIGETMAGLEKCLRYTMPEYDGMIYRVPFCQETVILKEILECLEALKRTEAAENLSKELSGKTGKKLKLSGNLTDFFSHGDVR